MAKRIRFPLKLAEGKEVRTLDELREYFDLEAVLEYYKNGKLLTWLEDRYLEGEAEAVRALAETEPDLQWQLCSLFQVEYTGDDDMDPEKIMSRYERLKRLRTFTDEAEYIQNIDSVAFDQEELADLLDKSAEVIYLCGKMLHIPVSQKNITYITYIGINKPINCVKNFFLILPLRYYYAVFSIVRTKFIIIHAGFSVPASFFH